MKNAVNTGETTASSILCTMDDGVESTGKVAHIFSGPNETEDTKELSRMPTREQENDQNDDRGNDMAQNEGQILALPSNNLEVAIFIPPLSGEWENEVEHSTMRKTPRQSILRKEQDLSSLAQSGRRRHKRRRVAFSMVEIRRYPMILGDNPATPAGPPLSLGWEYEVLPAMNVQDFESFRLRSRRTQTNHLILSQYKRIDIVERVRPMLMQKSVTVDFMSFQSFFNFIFACRWDIPKKRSRKLKRR